MRSLAALGALVVATTAMAGERTFVHAGDAARAACAVPGSGWQRGDFDDRAWALRVMTVRNPNGGKAATAGSAGSAAAATGNDKAIADSNRASASARTNAATANPQTDIASSSARANSAPSSARTNDATSSARSDNSTSSHADNSTSSNHADNSTSSVHSDNATSSHSDNATSSAHADNSSSSEHADNSSSSVHADNSSSSVHADNSSSFEHADNSSSLGHSDDARSSARSENSSSSRADNSTSSGNGNEPLPSEASAKAAPPDCLGARFARWHFAVNDLPSLQTITLRIRYSHGFAAYLNGTELARRRLDANAPPDALAGDVHGPEAERLIIPLRAGLLRRGDNVLAVEVHPHTAARESQMEVTLSADDSARIVRGPYLLNVRSNEVTVVFDTDLPTVGELQMGANGRYGAQRSDGIGVHHVLRIDGLNAGSIYHYRVRARSGTSLRVGETDDARGAIASADSDAHARSTTRDKNARIKTSETALNKAHENLRRANEQAAHVSGNETVRATDNNVRIAANNNSDVVIIDGARVATNQNARVATNQNARVSTVGDDRSGSDDRSVNDDRSAAGDRSSNDDSSADDQPTAPIDSAPTTPMLADSGDALFHTPADAGRPLRFAVYGDVRSGHDVHATLNRALADDEPDFAILTGDLVDRGSDDGDWERFFEVAGPLLRQLPIFPAIGNHEYASRGHGALAFMQFFRFPVAGESEPSWYSFDEGSAHFVALDSNQYKTSRQLSWLERDLKEARKRGARAIFVYAHEGPFSSGIHGDNSVCARDYVPIFERYKVSMLFTGHDHDFERGRVNNLDYIVTGGGGAELRSARCGVPGKRACPARVINFVNDHNYVMVELLPSLFRVCPKHVDGSPLEPCTVYPLR